MTTLNPSQQAAVASTAPRIIVSAGPGSGKSSVLIARIEHRISLGTDPARIYCITFTQAGAKVMSDRLKDKGITVGFVGTRHSLMYRLLNRFGPTIGYRIGGVNLITEDDAESLLLACAKDLGWKGSRKALDFAANQSVALIRKEYAHRLRRGNMCDFVGALTEGLRLLRLPDVAAQLAVDEAYTDEAQDNSRVDWQIDEELPAAMKFWVGDVDQAIFQWRGAEPAAFMEATQHPGTELITLEANYRSSTRICSAATNLIFHNKLRVPKEVVAATNAESVITVDRMLNDIEERRFVCRQINLYTNPSEVAVIVRTNDLREQFAEALLAAGIPVARTVQHQLPTDWQHGLNVLSLFNDPRNDFIAEKVIHRIAPEQVARCKEAALLEGNWLSSEAAKLGVFKTEISQSWPRIGALLPQWGVGPEMRQLVAERIALLPQPQPTLADLLQDLFRNDQWGGEPAGEGVSVLTYWGSKGREFDCVFLPCFEQGIIPSLKKDEDLEEARRVCFVACTRARFENHISWAETRVTQWRETLHPQPSQFISEMGLT